MYPFAFIFIILPPPNRICLLMWSTATLSSDIRGQCDCFQNITQLLLGRLRRPPPDTFFYTCVWRLRSQAVYPLTMQKVQRWGSPHVGITALQVSLDTLVRGHEESQKWDLRRETDTHDNKGKAFILQFNTQRNSREMIEKFKLQNAFKQNWLVCFLYVVLHAYRMTEGWKRQEGTKHHTRVSFK